MTTTETALGQVIDLDRYPLDRLDSPRGEAMIAFCHASLAFEGACQLPGFLRPDAVRSLVEEAEGMRARAHHTDGRHNVYLDGNAPVPDDLRAPAQHSSKSAIAWDLVGPDSPLRLAYESDELTRFLGRALGTPEIHRYADPLGAASLMIFDEGDELGWHFDRSPFAVTVMLQTALRGGAYEYHHDLRGPGSDSPDDDNPDGVRAALRDALPGRISLPNEPGTLSLFRGRNSLHRVTPVRGDRPRINAVLAYSARPGDRMNRLTSELFYGRSA